MGYCTFIDGYFVAQDGQCACGKKHRVPIQEIIVKPGAIQELAAMTDRLSVGKQGLAIADLNTYEAVGQDAITHLREAGYTIKLSLFHTRGIIHPDEYAVGKIIFDLEPGTSFLLVIGSGCLTDATRVISSRTGIPFISVTTAASMDGYASPGASMLIGGLKNTLSLGAPLAILADVDVLCAAPHSMTISGFGDLLGKLNSCVDWKLANLIHGEPYCQTIVDMVGDMVDSCVTQVEGIREHSPDALTALIQGLILSGVGMLMVGNSRPASGSEHHLSHYWEMKALTGARTEHVHGKKVGVGTAVMAKFYEKFFARDPFTINLKDVCRRKISRNAWEKRMHQVFGPVADSVIALKKEAIQDWEAQRNTIAAIQTHWETIKALHTIEPPHQRIEEILHAVGAAYRPQEIDVDADYLRETLLYAHNVRTQHTVMTVAESLGWLEDIVEDVINGYAS